MASLTNEKLEEMMAKERAERAATNPNSSHKVGGCVEDAEKFKKLLNTAAEDGLIDSLGAVIGRRLKINGSGNVEHDNTSIHAVTVKDLINSEVGARKKECMRK